MAGILLQGFGSEKLISQGFGEVAVVILPTSTLNLAIEGGTGDEAKAGAGVG